MKEREQPPPLRAGLCWGGSVLCDPVASSQHFREVGVTTAILQMSKPSLSDLCPPHACGQVGESELQTEQLVIDQWSA